MALQGSIRSQHQRQPNDTFPQPRACGGCNQNCQWCERQIDPRSCGRCESLCQRPGRHGGWAGQRPAEFEIQILWDIRTWHRRHLFLNGNEDERGKDQKLRLRNFGARHGRIGTGAVVKNRKRPSGVEGGKGTCYQWKEKGQCSKETDAVSGMRVTIVPKKPNHAAATPSESSFSRG